MSQSHNEVETSKKEPALYFAIRLYLLWSTIAIAMWQSSKEILKIYGIQ